MKKTLKTGLSIILSIIMLLTAIPLTGLSVFRTEVNANEILYGDTDGDGLITAKDARFILRASVGLESSDNELLELDGHDGITAADARLALRGSIGLEDIGPYGFELPDEIPERTANNIKLTTSIDDDTVFVTVSVTKPEDFIAYEMVINYDDDILQYDSYKLSSYIQSMSYSGNAASCINNSAAGEIKISSYALLDYTTWDDVVDEFIDKPDDFEEVELFKLEFTKNNNTTANKTDITTKTKLFTNNETLYDNKITKILFQPPLNNDKVFVTKEFKDNKLFVTLNFREIQDFTGFGCDGECDPAVLEISSIKLTKDSQVYNKDFLLVANPDNGKFAGVATLGDAASFPIEVFQVFTVSFDIIPDINTTTSISFSGDIGYQYQFDIEEKIVLCGNSHTDNNEDFICDECHQDSYKEKGSFDNCNLEWRFYDNGTLIISGNGDMENYSYDGYGSPWYDFRTEIKKVIIKEGISSVGNAAFEGCENITSIELDDSIQSINWRAFAGCKKLTDIDLPDNLSAIGQSAFEECEMLTNISFPEKLKSISSSAFAYSGLTGEIFIPAGVTEILDAAFIGCNKLTAISVDNGNAVYASNNGVLINKNEKTLMLYPIGKTQKEYIIPDNIETIASNAFSGNKYLENIVISNSVKDIGFSAFTNCTALKSIKITMYVKNLGVELFTGCTSIKSIYFDGINTLIPYGKYELDLPEGTSVYGYNNSTAIEYVEYINHIYESEYHKFISLGDYTGKAEVIDSGAFGTNLTYSVNNLGVLTISGQGDMNDWEGWDNPFIPYSITEIIIENGITSIGDCAFIDYGKVKKVTIPDSVTHIGKCAFMSCSSLESVTIPEKVNTIGKQAFSYTNLKKITILNADTVIESCETDGSEDIPIPYTIEPKTEIYGYNNSTAKKYAEAYGNEFVSLDENKPHTHSYTSTVTKPASCKETGIRTFTCECKDSYTEVIPVTTSHSFGGWKVTSPATYEKAGTEERTCSVCKKKESRAIAKLEYSEITFKEDDKVKEAFDSLSVLSTPETKVGELLNKANGNLSVVDKDGKAVKSDDTVKSGMVITLKDKNGKVLDTKTVVVPGDNDGDGKISAADARTALRASVKLEKLNSWQTAASNVDDIKQNSITAADARFILRTSVKLESIDSWMKAV